MWGTLNPFPFFTGGSQPAPAQRYILTLNGVNSYIDTGGYTYSGDFWIEVTAQLPAVLPASNQAFFGGSGGGSPNAGAFTLFLNPAQNTISTQIPTSSGGTRHDLGVSAASYLGKVVKFRIERLSGVWTLQIDDVLVDTYDSNPHGVVDMEVTSIGRWSTTLYYSGAIYNYKDSLGNDLPIDDNSTTVIRNAGSGADATPINVTPSMWSLIDV